MNRRYTRDWLRILVLAMCGLSACGDGGGTAAAPGDAGEQDDGNDSDDGQDERSESGDDGNDDSPSDSLEGEATSPPEIEEIGVLPDPLSLPDDMTPEELADYLVSVTRSWSSDALPAYEAALLEAGYTIKNGEETLFEPTESNGIVIQAWDVQASKALLDRGMASGLAELVTSLNGVIEGVELDLTQNMIDAVASAKSSGVPSLEFWADLLIELGRQADVPHDWTTLSSDEGVQLSPPEVLLLFTRMAADVLSVTLPEDQRPIPLPSDPPEPDDAFAGTPQALSSSPCQLTNEQQLILDVNAAGMGKAFDTLTHFAGVERYTDFTGLANLVMIYVKLAWTFLAFDADIHFTTDPQSLTRTKTTTAGERKTLEVIGKFDTKNSQILNCVRPALNVAGLDFSLPSNGPIAGAEVHWKILTGGTIGGAHPQFGFVEFVGSDPLNGKTDDEGSSKIDIEGARQRVTIKPDALPIKRKARVYAGFVIKPANIFQDLTDAVSTANFSGLSTLLATPAEMFYRTSEVFGKSWSFPVTDWSMGTLRWQEVGTISWSDEDSDSSGSTSRTISASYEDVRTYEVTQGNGTLLFGNLQGIVFVKVADMSFNEHIQYDTSDSRSQCDEGASKSVQVDIASEGLDSPTLVEPDIVVDSPSLISIEGEGDRRYTMVVGLNGFQLEGTAMTTTRNGLECSEESMTEKTSAFTRRIEGGLHGVYEGSFQGHREYHGPRKPAYSTGLLGDEPEYETEIVVDWDFAIPVTAP